MNDKITDNNDLNGNGLVVDGSTINVTPISNVDSYNASINSNVNNGVYQNVSGTVNNSVYTMNDINNMSNNLQSVDNGNFMMVDKANAQSNTMPVVQISDNGGVSNAYSANGEVNNGVKITENVSPNLNSSAVGADVQSTIKITPTASNGSSSGGGKGKTVFLILFFIVLFAFILFLPTISEIINTGNLPFKKTSEVQNGILICSMKNESDLTDTTYEMKFSFRSKKLVSSILNVTVNSEDKVVVNEKNAGCQVLKEIPIEGVEVECTLSGSVSNTKYNYNYQMIDNNNLTKFTEAGGIYPEHKYKQNIYDIQSSMVKNGYDCEIRGN